MLKNKVVKVLSSLFVTAIILATAVVTAVAKEYTINDVGVTVNLPDDMEVVTRETASPDEVYKKYNAKGQNFGDYGIYIQGFSQDKTQIFTLTVTQDENSKKVDNYNTLSEEMLNQLKDNFTTAENCQSCSMDTYNDVIYFDSIINTPSQDEKNSFVYVTQADTVVNGKYYNFTLQSLDGEISQDDKEVMTEILQSVVYDDLDKEILSENVYKFIILIVAVLVAIIVVILIVLLIKKSKKKKKLEERNREIYHREKAERQQTRINRQHRNTATGAERPDAFFDGVDGLESLDNMEQLEKELIKEAHQQYQLQVDEEENSDFFHLDENNGNRKTKRSKITKNKRGNSSRKF